MRGWETAADWNPSLPACQSGKRGAGGEGRGCRGDGKWEGVRIDTRMEAIEAIDRSVLHSHLIRVKQKVIFWKEHNSHGLWPTTAYMSYLGCCFKREKQIQTFSESCAAMNWHLIGWLTSWSMTGALIFQSTCAVILANYTDKGQLLKQRNQSVVSVDNWGPQLLQRWHLYLTKQKPLWHNCHKLNENQDCFWFELFLWTGQCPYVQ